MASFIVLHKPSLFNYSRNLWPQQCISTQVREKLGPHFFISSWLHNLHQEISKFRYKKWWGFSHYLHRHPYSTNHCKHHQNKGLTIHQLLQRRNYCLGICFLVDFYKCQLSPYLHPHLHWQPITVGGTLIMQFLNHLYSSKHIVHFINHLHTIDARTLQHPWQWPWRQISKRWWW